MTFEVDGIEYGHGQSLWVRVGTLKTSFEAKVTSGAKGHGFAYSGVNNNNAGRVFPPDAISVVIRDENEAKETKIVAR